MTPLDELMFASAFQWWRTTDVPYGTVQGTEQVGGFVGSGTPSSLRPKAKSLKQVE